jgi:hypothetical protein
MPCKHGTPYAQECLWTMQPPSCTQCEMEHLVERLEELKRENIRLKQDIESMRLILQPPFSR